MPSDVARPTVWLIDADHWPRALLRAELIERGYDAIGFATLDEAIVRLARERPLRPGLVLIDLAGQELTRGAVALLSAGDVVPVIGLVGAVEAAEAQRLGFTALLRRPLSLGQIADAVRRQLAGATPPSSESPSAGPRG
jgi:DNA-binding NtrC family response regulator